MNTKGKKCVVPAKEGSDFCFKHGENKSVKPTSNKNLKDGAKCKVMAGTHAGKSGIVRDIKTSKTGILTITVVQPNGERFKTLAKSIELL